MSLTVSRGRNFRIMLFLKAISWVGAFVMGVQTVRQFASPDNQAWLGQLAFFNAVVFPITLFGASWLDPGYSKFIAQEQKKLPEFFWTLVCLKMVFCTVLSMLGIALAFVFDVSREGLMIFLPILGANLLSVCSPAKAFDLKGRGALETGWKTVTDLIYIGIVLWLLCVVKIQGPEIWLLPAMLCVVGAVSLVGSVMIYSLKVEPLPIKISMKRARQLVHFGRPMIFSGLSEKLPGNFDTFLLRFFFGAQGYVYCAIYSVPQRLLKYARDFNKIVFRQFAPEIYRRYSINTKEASELFEFSFYVVGFLSCGFWVIGAYYSEEIIITLFSEEFSEASTCLVYLFGAFCFRHLAKVCNIYMIAANMNKEYARNQFVMAFAAISFSLIAVPLWKYEGAALAMMGTYLVACTLSWTCALHHVDKDNRPNLFKCALPLAVALGTLAIIESPLYSVGANIEQLFRGFFSLDSWHSSFFVKAMEFILEFSTLAVQLIISFLICLASFWYLGPLSKIHKKKFREIFSGIFRLPKAV